MSETSFRYDLSPIEKYEVTPVQCGVNIAPKMKCPQEKA
jgi:hypothetical protein